MCQPLTPVDDASARVAISRRTLKSEHYPNTQSQHRYGHPLPIHPCRPHSPFSSPSLGSEHAANSTFVEAGQPNALTAGLQFVVVELCDDLRNDLDQPANFEFFSGAFEESTVSVAKSYAAADAEGWTIVGKNVRGVQVSLRPVMRFQGHPFFAQS